MPRRMKRLVRDFVADSTGVALVEALVVVPVLTILTVGMLEFPNMLWERQQMQIGVRDAVRYWSRCRPDFNPCSQTIARNIAFYGNPAGTGALRVPGWNDAAELTLTPITPPASPTAASIVTGTGTLPYVSSPLFGALQIDAITMSYSYSQRYIGW